MQEENIHEDSEIRDEPSPENIPDGMMSIQEFIEQKRLQNKILGELIEKIKKSNQEPSND